jgi:cell division protein ZapA (FtsZ GTPase activity inhibitor)
MSEISIKINIGNRTYPLTVQAHEEETIREAAKLVNDHIKTLQENYAVKDMQDLLAMSAIQVASKFVVAKTQAEGSKSTPVDLTELNHLLDSALKKV